MLTQIDVVYGDELGEQALAPPILGITPKDSLLVRKITGLSPPDLDLFIGDYARDGGTYQGRRVGNRNVVITIDLNPNPALGETVSGLRALLYKTFVDPLVDADHVQLILHDDEVTPRYVLGYTEKLETEIFDVETTVQVSMICPDPYIRAESETLIPSNDPLIDFVYKGTAETGFKAQIEMSAASSVLTLSNNNKTMVITHPFLEDDVININTNRGERDITLTRLGVVSPLIAKLSNASRWLELHSKANTMEVYGLTVEDEVAILKSIRYSATFWGV